MSASRSPSDLLRALAPGAEQLHHYDRRHLRGDIVGGVTLMAYLIPQVMAYTVLAGLPAQVGLWAAVAAMVVYAFLGTSRLLSMGPESTTAILTAATLGPLAGGDPLRYASLAAALALMVGLIALVAWILRAGILADLLSRPVLVGYMAGIAVIMLMSQIDDLTGVDTTGETLPQQVVSFIEGAAEQGIAVPSLLLGLAVVVALVTLAHRLPRVPLPLIVVLIAALIAWALRGAGVDLPAIGPIPNDIPRVGWWGFTFDDLRLLFFPAVGITVVAYADNVLTGRSFAERHHHRIRSQSEWLALSGANIAASLVRGYPVSSSASRAALADAAGARTQLHSLIGAVAVVVVILTLGGVLATFPVAALGGLVAYAALRLIDLPEFRRLWRFRRSEFLFAAAATSGVLLVDVLYGILIAVALSIGDLLLRVARPHAAVLGQVPDLPGWHDVGDYEGAEQIPGLVVFRWDSPLIFANADLFVSRCLDAVDQATPPAEWLLINVEAVSEVDITGLDGLAEVARRCRTRGVTLALVRAKSELVEDLRRHGVLEAIGPQLVFPTLPTAVAAYLVGRSES